MITNRTISRKDVKGRALRKGESQRSLDGMYIYAYTDPLGRRRYIYSKNLVELREKENNLIHDQLDKLDIYAAGKATVDMTFDRYISVKYNLKETTKRNYNYMYDQYVRGGFGTKKLADVKYSDIKAFYNYLLKEKRLAINTLGNINNVLSQTFTLAVRDNIIRNNPVSGVMAELTKNQGKNKGIRRALTNEQERAFLEYIKTSPEYVHWLPVMVTLLGTGVRIGEFIGLTWKDIDLEKKVISINHNVSYISPKNQPSYYKVSKPKTNAGIRTIPMIKEVFEVLSDEYHKQKILGFNDYELDGMSKFVFYNKLGRIHNPHCINQAIKRIIENHNIEELVSAKKEKRAPLIIPVVSCHDLRHTFCSRLCESEMSIKVIQDVMGHADIRTTLDIYAEIDESKKHDVIDNFSEMYSLY